MNPHAFLLTSYHAALMLAIAIAIALSSSHAQELPPDSEYVVVDSDGHLSVNGKRQRYWAAIGKPLITAGIKPDDSSEVRASKLEISRKGTDAILDHFELLGFNSVRMWNTNRNAADYVVGDGSAADCIDYFIAEAKKRGFRLWAAGVGNGTGHPSPDDVDIVADPSTAEAWKKAIAETQSGEKRIDLRHNIARAWDPRLEALTTKRMRENAQHLNKHTGLRWSDDPVFAVWELTNEEWWMRKMVGGQWQKLPAFFRNQLVAQWNKFLKEKYGDNEKLKAAWDSLLPGESIETGSVIFAPMAGKTDAAIAMNDANEQARASLTALESEYTREDFSAARGTDVLEFLMDLQLAHKLRLAAEFKEYGKSTRLSPLVLDTGIGYEIHSQYLHQSADAVSHNAYVNGWGPVYREPELTDSPRFAHQNMLRQLEAERISANVGNWNNWLLKPPGIAQGVPWLEHNRTVGKPFLVYETQIQQPAKYRADFPLRLVALASIQDWDWISWHYFQPSDDVGIVENPFEKPLDVTTGRHPQGYHYTYDEIQNAMMRAAGFIFRNEALQPASNPTTFIFGRRSLHDPESMDYAGSYGKRGMDMLQTTYQHGLRIQIDPSREDDEIIGPVVTFDERKTHNPYTPTKEIVFDWKKGFLTFDSPEAVAFTGYIGRQDNAHQFENGVLLKEVSIHNPEGIFDPVKPEENYIAFALFTLDGEPLDKTKRASLSIVSTSFNTGFELGTKFTQPHLIPEGTKGGTGPVLVARVGATIEAPALNGMTYTARDWNKKVIDSGTVEDGIITIRKDQPVFIIEFTR